MFKPSLMGFLCGTHGSVSEPPRGRSLVVEASPGALTAPELGFSLLWMRLFQEIWGFQRVTFQTQPHSSDLWGNQSIEPRQASYLTRKCSLSDWAPQANGPAHSLMSSHAAGLLVKSRQGSLSSLFALILSILSRKRGINTCSLSQSATKTQPVTIRVKRAGFSV